MRLVTSLTLVFASSVALAAASQSESGKGYWVAPKYHQGHQVKRVGESAKFEGTICHGQMQKNQTLKCKEIDRDAVKILAFFPDETTEVTTSTNLSQAVDSEILNFEFNSPALTTNLANRFSVLVVDPKVDLRMSKIRAKIERRLVHFNNRLVELRKKSKSQDQTKLIEKYIAVLSEALTSVEKTIDEDPAILAKLSYVPQLENQTAGPLLASSIFNQTRFALTYSSSVPMEGTPLEIRSRILNLAQSNQAGSLSSLKTDKKDPSNNGNGNSNGNGGSGNNGSANNNSDGQGNSGNSGNSQDGNQGNGNDDGQEIDEGKFELVYKYQDQILSTQANVVLKVNTPIEYVHSIAKVKRNESLAFSLNVRERKKGNSSLEPFGSISMIVPALSDDVAPTWVEPIQPSVSTLYAKELPQIIAGLVDSLGSIDQASIKILINGNDNSDKLQLTDIDSGKRYSISADINPVSEGPVSIQLSASDLVGNKAQPDPLVRTLRIDRTAPVITFIGERDFSTNQPEVPLNFSISDASPVSVEISLNSIKIQEFEKPQDGSESFLASVVLLEGSNRIRISAFDVAGNISEAKEIVVTRDSTPPVLSNITPPSGSIISSLNISGALTVSEPLSQLTVNDNPIELTAGSFTFNWIYAAQSQGAQDVVLEATDLAGNVSTKTLNYTILTAPIDGNLMTIVPAEDGNILVIGGAGASDPGTLVTANGGLLNTASVTSNADGSFSILLKKATSVAVSATANGISKTVALNYDVNTKLSGVVKNSLTGNPLMGVKVIVDGSTVITTTDANGVFSIPNVPTGDRVVTIDGSEIPSEVRGPYAKFFSTKIAVNVGDNQINVIEDAIYLTPLITDGTEVNIVSNQAATVTSPHAPGVQVSVPAGSAVFPDGTKAGKISMITIDADRTTVPPLDFAVPENVVALEPSGLSFSQPVQLSLPNDNEIDPGVQMVILSKNSAKGIWEIDGVARVSEDGSKIVTEPGQGITHFSEVYAAPLGPKVGPIGSRDRPGADTMNGSLSNRIDLPSFKSLGANVTPSLVYKSSWAKPTVAVSTLIDVPKNEVELGTVSGGGRNLIVKQNVTMTGKAWIKPAYVDSQFITDSVISQKFRSTGVPNQSVISFGIDLSEVESGVYPYSARHEIKLKQMTLTTRTTSTKKFLGKTKVSQETFLESRAIDGVFPQDAAGTIFTQNRISSEAGRGWKIVAGPQLYNLDSPRIMLEGPDGSVSSYGLSSTIETLYDAGTAQLRAVDFNTWPQMSYVDETNTLKKINLLTKAITHQSSVERPNKSGTFEDGVTYVTFSPFVAFNWIGDCWRVRFKVSYPRDVRGVLDLGANGAYGVDFTGAIFKLSNNVSTTISANGTTLPRKWIGGNETAYVCGNGTNRAACPGAKFCSTSDISKRGTCTWDTTNRISLTGGPTAPKAGAAQLTGNYEGNLAGTACDPKRTSPIEFPRYGFKDGALSQALFNDPQNIAPGFGNKLVVVDMGNNRVRLLNLADSTVSTIAGNGQNLDLGDGGQATSASLFHPTAATYDASGNLYIATERGLIRRVDTRGVITRFAGKLPSEGGVLNDSAHAEQMIFTKPMGLAVDNTNGYLYVADTGNHRIVQIDLATKQANLVAGNGTCEAIVKDGISAINSSLCNPEDVGIDSDGNLLIADTGHGRIRRVAISDNISGQAFFEHSVNDRSKLERKADGSFVQTSRDGTQALFDQAGKCTSVQDRVGRAVRYIYDGSGRLTSQVDPVGQEIKYEYIGGLLSAIVDPAGRRTTFLFNGANLAQVKFPDNTTRNFEYINDGVMSRELDQRGFASTYAYNSYGRLRSVKKANGSEVVLNDSVSQTLVNNYTGGTSGQLKKYGTGQGEVYDGVKDAKSTETQFVRDINGFVVKVVDRGGKETKIEQNKNGQPVKIERADGSYVTFVYDSTTSDLLSSFDSGTGLTKVFVYDSYGNVLQESIAGVSRTRVFDNRGLLTSETDATGLKRIINYNSIGLPTSLSDVRGAATVFSETREYDAKGRLTRTIDSEGDESRSVFDSVGNIVSSVAKDNISTTYAFDSFNRLTSVLSPKQELTQYSYLPTGELLQIQDSTGRKILFTYNSVGQLVEKRDGDEASSLYSYDANGNLTQQQDPSGKVRKFEYDNLDQMTKKILPDDVYTYVYDVRGSLISVQNNVSQVLMNFDSADRLRSSAVKGLGSLSSFPQVTVSYEYNELGQRTRMIDSLGGSVQYAYSQSKILSSITNQLNQVFGFGYDSRNRLNQISGLGYTTAINFGNSGFVGSITHSYGSAVREFFEYTRDGVGYPTSIRTRQGSSNFQYDSNRFLTSATHSSSPQDPETVRSFANESFSYDAIGNRVADSFGQISYDQSRQRLNEDYKYRYNYDGNGNLIQKVEKATEKWVQYNYSSENQLVSIKYFPALFSSSPTKEISYAYDAVGRRIQKQVIDHEAPADPVRTFTRRFVYDESEIVAELDGSNVLLARYTHSSLRTDDVLAVDVTSSGVSRGIATAAGTYTYLKDVLGTVRSVANTTGQVVQNYRYSAFGVLLGVSNSEGIDISQTPVLRTSYGFTGREHDAESGLYYYRARYYDPGLGRFLAADPDSGKLAYPLSIVSRHIYALNSPTRYTDPTGQSPWNVITKTFSAQLQLAVIPILAGISSFNSAQAAGGSFLQQIGVAASSVVFTSAAIAVTVAANFFLTPWGADLVTPFTSGLIAMAHNTTNQLIMTGKVDGNRAWRAGVKAATYQALANAASGYWNGTPLGAYADTTSSAAIVACTDDGVSPKSKEELDKEGALDFSCNFRYGF